jgi:mycothiol system anti-sigma-R factor
MECLDCVQTTARLHLYIGQELSADEVKIVQQHLATCPHCDCRFHFDIHIKKLIQERCIIENAPAHLREAVMRLVHGGYVAIDSELERD